MAEERWTRREILIRSGKLSLALGGGAITARLLTACDTSADADGVNPPDAASGDGTAGGEDAIAVEDVGGGYYMVASRRGLRTARYTPAEA